MFTFIQSWFYKPVAAVLLWSLGFTTQFETPEAPVVYIYNGPGTAFVSVIGAALSCKELLKDHAYTIRFIGPDALKEGCWLQDACLFVMPGGASTPYAKSLEPEGNGKIHRFVETGGTYLGFCAGAYYAGSQVIFAPNTNTEVVRSHALKFYDESIYGPVLAPYSYTQASGACIAQVQWLSDEASVFHCYYNGGGAFLYPNRVHNMQALGYFKNRPLNVPNGKGYEWIKTALLDEGALAIVEISVGNGRALLSSCHPEISHALLKFCAYFRQDPYLDTLLPKLELIEVERQALMRHLFERCGLDCN